MKKIIYFLAFCSVFAIASTSFATTTFSDASNTNATYESSIIGATMFKPSPKVTVCVVATETTFKVAAKHFGGTRVYSSSEDNPGIIKSDENVALKGKVITAEDKTGGISSPTLTFDD